MATAPAATAESAMAPETRNLRMVLNRLLEHRLGDAGGQWQRPFDLAQDRQQDEEVEEVVERAELGERHPETLRRMGAAEPEYDQVDHQHEHEPLIDRPEGAGANPRRVEPRQQEQHADRAE